MVKETDVDRSNFVQAIPHTNPEHIGNINKLLFEDYKQDPVLFLNAFAEHLQKGYFDLSCRDEANVGLKFLDSVVNSMLFDPEVGLKKEIDAWEKNWLDRSHTDEIKYEQEHQAFVDHQADARALMALKLLMAAGLDLTQLTDEQKHGVLSALHTENHPQCAAYLNDAFEGKAVIPTQEDLLKMRIKFDPQKRIAHIGNYNHANAYEPYYQKIQDSDVVLNHDSIYLGDNLPHNHIRDGLHDQRITPNGPEVVLQ